MIEERKYMIIMNLAEQHKKLRINEHDRRAERAYWKYVECDGVPEGFYLKCSYCGYDISSKDADHICANCGARMSY